MSETKKAFLNLGIPFDREKDFPPAAVAPAAASWSFEASHRRQK